MMKSVFMSTIEKICMLDSGSLTGGENIKDADYIDSLSLLELIAILDKDFHVNYSVEKIINAGTFNDLYMMVSSS